MDKQPLRHILNSQPSSEHRVSSKVLSIEGYYSINIFSDRCMFLLAKILRCKLTDSNYARQPLGAQDGKKWVLLGKRPSLGFESQ